MARSPPGCRSLQIPIIRDSPNTCPRTERRLAPRTPEQVPSAELGGPDPAAAQVAGLSVPAVDIGLSPVVVLSRVPAHHLGRVPDVHGVDPTGAEAVPHQLHEGPPERGELATPE